MTCPPTPADRRFSPADALACLHRELQCRHGIAPGRVPPDSHLQADLGLDSLAVVDLLLALLDAAGRRLPRQVPLMTTVAQVCEFVAGDDPPATPCFLNLRVG